MKKYQKTFFLLSVLVLPLILSACHVPILDKEITIPFFEKKGEDVVRLSIEAMEKLDTYSFENSLNIDIDFKDGELGFLSEETKDNIVAMINDGSPKVLGIDNVADINIANPKPKLDSFPEKINVNCKAKGKVDTTDKNNLKSSSNIVLNFDLGGTSFDADLDIIITGKVLYFKVNKIPFFADSLLSGMGIDLGAGWWKLAAETEKLSENNFFNLNKDLSENFKDETKRAEIKQKLSEILKKYSILNVNERSNDVKVGGEKHYHFKSSINVKDFVEFIKEASEAAYKEIKIEDNQKQKTIETVNNLQKILNRSDIELWINKKSFYLKKAFFDLVLKVPKDDSASLSSIIEAKGFFEYSDFNKQMNISAPKNANDIVLVINEKLEMAKIKARDAKRLSDAKQIQTALELYYSDQLRYPENLSALTGSESGEIVSDFWPSGAYLFDLPKDVKPNNECGEEYNVEYVVKEDGNNFDLSFCLENGAGKYPKGINIFNAMVSSSTRVEMFNTKPIIQGAMLDSDNDGLNDFEEEMIYFTEVNNPDTDEDGYSDGDEVKNGYNPGGGGKLNGECREDFDCEKYVSYNSCEVMCINRNSDKNSLENGKTCDSALWDPPLELNCGCVDKVCIFK